LSVQTINLPAGTNVTKHLALPKAGGWLGYVQVSISTYGTAGTINEWLFINPDVGDGKIRYRRTGGTLAGNFFDGPLPVDQRGSRGLYKGESLMRIKYTLTNDLTVCIETTRSLTPAAYPAIPASSGSSNAIVIPGNSLAGKVYWLAAS
jgi:hypothetical protein